MEFAESEHYQLQMTKLIDIKYIHSNGISLK